MKKFEYLSKIWTYAEFSNQADRLGDLGWELITVLHRSNTDHFTYYFKKEKQ